LAQAHRLRLWRTQLSAQKSSPGSQKSSRKFTANPKPMTGRSLLLFCTLLLISWEAASQLRLRPTVDTTANKVSLQVLPQNFYTKNLGFTCRTELQVQKALKLPVFFRLGNKEYVDRLERKPNSSIQTKQ
jgi:hypothetical protein